MTSTRYRTTVLALILILSGITAWKIGELTNTFAKHPQWKSTKLNLGIKPSGSIEFVSGRNTMAHNQLDLGAWHGRNEIFHDQNFKFGRAHLKAKMSHNSYLVVMFRTNGEEYLGVRVSRNSLFPSAVVTMDSARRFLTKRKVNIPIESSDWQDWEITNTEKGFYLRIGQTEAIPLGGFYELSGFGLRSGKEPVLVDSIALFDKDGRQIEDENFINDEDIFINFLLAFHVFLLLNFLIFRTRIFQAEPVLLNTSFLIGVIVLSAFDEFYFSERYYLNNYLFSQRRHEYLFEEWRDRIDKDIDSKSFSLLSWIFPKAYAAAGTQFNLMKIPKDSANAFRIMVIGSSQTFGEGSSSQEKKWTDLLQKKFDTSKKAKVVVLNAGVKGMRVKSGFEEFKRSWVRWNPHMVVLIFGNNDEGNSDFQKHLDEFAQFNNEKSVQMLFVLEANDIESPHPERQTIQLGPMAYVAEKYDAKFFNADTYFRDLQLGDSGFLWWDHVHFADYGHQMMAEKVYSALTH